jgi:HK97 family phage prohead protease
VERFAVECRAAVEGSRLVGHASVFDQTAEIRGHYECLAPSAFDAALDGGADPRFLLNHDPSRLLGRRSAGTLRLDVDERGLAFEVDLPDTEDGRTVRELTRRGDLSGASFAFVPGEDAWTRAPDGRQLRTHTSIAELLDLSVVTYPAYEGAGVALRSLTITARPSGRTRSIRARHRALTLGGRK